MIYKCDTEQHLKKCSKVLQDFFVAHQPFRSVGCNIVESVPSDDIIVPAEDPAENIDDITQKLLLGKSKLIEMIKSRVPNFHVPDESVSFTDTLQTLSTTQSEEEEPSASELKKHDLQNAYLLDLLKANNLQPTPDNPRLYAELGCGKAGLSHWLIESLPEHDSESPSSVFLLVDYEARRHKKENIKQIFDKVPQSSIVRLRLNLADVDLGEFLQHRTMTVEPQIANPGKPGSVEYRIHELVEKVHGIQARPDWPLKTTIGTAKHLCGAATDFGIRALARVGNRSNVSLVFATCCHHRCDWNQLVGQTFLRDAGVCSSASEFRFLTGHAGWATTAGLPEEKRVLGRLIKSVIDLSRIAWISERFHNIQYIEYRKYINESVTPENFAILVRSD